MENVIVVGGGAAGIMAALSAGRSGRVILLEKNEKLGKKLYITGKGRCNLTNLVPVPDFLEKVARNPSFLYSSLSNMDSYQLVEFFEGIGLPTKCERGNRVFPKSDKSSDVIRVLQKELNRLGVDIRLNTAVKSIIIEEGRAVGVLTESGEIRGDKVVVATGGLSYPRTGSTGDGYVFAQAAGHSLTPRRPSLVALVSDDAFVPELQGLSLKNVSVTAKVGKKSVFSGFGEMLFTERGVSGPLILSASQYLEPDKDANIYIDLKPALDENELYERIRGDFLRNSNKNFLNSLNELLPQRLIKCIIELSEIPENKKVNGITKEERRRLCSLLKSMKIHITDTEGFSSAVITRGGVKVSEVNPATLESKRVSGLFFAGEVLDVDAATGGFNLQIAFSTGFLAGKPHNR
ncbi:FAD-dependent oxidoreductase [Clostridia bacterium]|nr:FAD-dependent oxidoreductase [Clostridia bacterium]